MSIRPPTLCDAADAVLMVIDMQVRLTAAMPAKVLARLQRNTGLLIRSAAELGIPVFASEQYPEGLGQIEPEILKLLPDGAGRYEKTGFSCALAPRFMEDLERTGRKQAVLIGMEAHVCVLQTAFDLRDAGYAVSVVSDAVCSRHRENYETALARLRHAGVDICDAESVVFEWLRDARHEQFKALHKLVR